MASAGAFIKSDLPFRYFEPASYGFIGDVYTEPRFRGSGVATNLNVEAIAWLRTRCVKSVRLLATDAGRPLHEMLGFSASDEILHLNPKELRPGERCAVVQLTGHSLLGHPLKIGSHRVPSKESKRIDQSTFL